MVQWLRLHTPNAGGPGLIPGWGTSSHMPQLRPSADKQINAYFLRTQNNQKTPGNGICNKKKTQVTENGHIYCLLIMLHKVNFKSLKNFRTLSFQSLYDSTCYHLHRLIHVH